MSQRTSMFGVQVTTAGSMGEVLDTIDASIASGEHSYVCSADVHALMECQSEPEVRCVYNAAGIVAPDGMPLVRLLHGSGYPAADRVCGPDLLPQLFARSESRNDRHCLYGSTERTLARLRQALERQYPQARIVGTSSPPFRAMTQEEESAIVNLINDADPHIVWVGLCAPNRDRWMTAHRDALSAPVVIGVGTAFDIIAGIVQRTPPILRRTGCEWMCRVAKEPRRLWKHNLKSNSQFAMMVFGEKMHLLKHRLDA
jgi:N-acetylglucosaminyldiphosphoundecaprenol N-acetyl-beta-D-mannosaminyltransferase